MRHQWANADGLEYNPNESKSVCKRCKLIRLRMSNLKSQENVVYYHPTAQTLTTYRAPKCKLTNQ
jgi:hypothetical protein